MLSGVSRALLPQLQSEPADARLPSTPMLQMLYHRAIRQVGHACQDQIISIDRINLLIRSAFIDYAAE